MLLITGVTAVATTLIVCMMLLTMVDNTGAMVCIAAMMTGMTALLRFCKALISGLSAGSTVLIDEAMLLITGVTAVAMTLDVYKRQG